MASQPTKIHASLHSIIVTTTTCCQSGLLSLQATICVILEYGCGGELNVLCRGHSNEEGWLVDHLLSNRDMPLVDHDACVMDRLCKVAVLGHKGLKTALHELRYC